MCVLQYLRVCSEAMYVSNEAKGSSGALEERAKQTIGLFSHRLLGNTITKETDTQSHRQD